VLRSETEIPTDPEERVLFEKTFCSLNRTENKKRVAVTCWFAPIMERMEKLKRKVLRNRDDLIKLPFFILPNNWLEWIFKRLESDLKSARTSKSIREAFDKSDTIQSELYWLQVVC
jgi:hypothetical protein